jgi:glucose/arabinose dehydrogenase/mono/diheme cytochrome c family protein
MVRWLSRPFILTALLLIAVGVSPSRGAEEPEYQLGLVGEYTQSNPSKTIKRIDDDVQFDWENGRPDERLDHADFHVTWRGQLFINQPGRHRFHLFVVGEASLRIADKAVAQTSGSDAKWVDSEPVELVFGYQPIEITYRKTGANARIGVYWSSESFEREPVGTQRLWHVAATKESRSPDLLAVGARCSACHDIPVEHERAPALDQIAGAIDEGWLIKSLTADAKGGHSVDFGFSADEARDVASYLLASSTKALLAKPGTGDEEKGQQVVESLGCFACHRIDDLGAHGPLTGGDLTQIAAKRPLGFFASWLRNPTALNADHRMPLFELTEEEVNHLTTYLSTLKEDSPELPVEAESKIDLARGKQLVQQNRCANCHRLSDEKAVPLIPFVVNEGSPGCFSNPSREKSQPGYHLSEDQSSGLREYLVSLPKTETPLSAERRGLQVLEKNHCLGCHPRGNEDGLRDIVAELGRSDPREQAVRVAPSLNSVGDKLQDAWLGKAVMGQAPARRPWLSPRMPKFKHTKEEQEALVGYFAAHDRMPPFERPETGNVNREQHLVAAQRLVGPAGFGCMSCHQIGKFIPAVGEPSARGPDLSGLGDRIRFEWYRRWTRNPTRIVSGVEMPAINLASPGLLGGDIETQLSALWEGLNTTDFQVPAIAAVQSLTAINEKEPIIFRDIFEHKKGDSTTRVFAVGFPNGHSLLLDLDRFAVRRWWFGDFANEQTRGKTWYWQTAGTTLIDDKNVPPMLALLHSGKFLLPKGPGQAVTQLKEWHREAGRVVFEARVFFEGDQQVDVTGTIAATERGIRLSLLAKNPDAGQSLICLLPSQQASMTTPLGHSHVTVKDGIPANSFSGMVPAKSSAFAVTAGSVSIEWQLDTVVEPLTSIKRLPSDPSPRKELKGLPGYEVVRLSLPDGPMPTGMAFHADGSMFVTSLKGGVFHLRDTNGDGEYDTYHPFADELSSPFGVVVDGNDILVAHKPELVRLKDTDGDDYADRADVVSSGWGVTSDYHDWMVGPVPAKEGGYYLALSCQQDKRSPAAAIGRGKLLRSTPDRGFEIVTSGLRFPMGLTANQAGELFASDNQGVTNPFNELNHLRPGKHFGFFSSLEQRSPDQVVEVPAIEIPHPWTGSVNGIVFVPGDEKFGPYAGQLIGAEYTTRRLIRMSLEQVGDTFQGCTYPFGEAGRQAIEKDETFLGPISLAFAKDGSLYVGSMIDSGWGGGNNRGAIERVRFNGKLPFGIREVRSWKGGFDIDFAGEANPDLASDVKSYTVSRYRRIHTAGYATPDRDRAPVTISTAQVSNDRRSVRLTIDDMKPGFVYDIAIGKLREGSEAAYPKVAFYTLNVVPDVP